MKDFIYDILSLIESSGFEAYIVGGFVRDKILGNESKDIDIITNAKPKDLFKIFKNNIKVREDYGSVKLIVNDHHVDITTYRKDLDYKDNRPSSVEYIEDVYEDLLRRDFTINTILMNKDGKILDLLNSITDISSRIIKTVGDINVKFEEDALRILRAIRFMTVLNFKLNPDIIKYIDKNKEALSKISFYKRKEELEKIFSNKNHKRFFIFVKKYKLEKPLGIKFKNIVNTNNIIGIWAQIEFDENYSFNNNEKKQIEQIKYLVNKKNITNYDIYKYGSYICMNAALILKKNPKRINKIYTSLPINGIIDIEITCDEICEILNIRPSSKIGEIYSILEHQIIDGKLKNEKKTLKEYIKKVK